MKTTLCFCCFIGSFVFANPDEVTHLSKCAESAGVYQGIDGWLFFSGDLVETIEINNTVLPYLERLQQALTYRGITVLIANLPARGMFHDGKFDLTQEVFSKYRKEIAIKSFLEVNNFLMQFGFIMPNLLEAVKNSGHGQQYGFARDSHWAPVGERVAAEAVANAIEILPVYKSLQKKVFEIVEAKSVYASGFARWIESKCPEITVPNEIHQRYRAISPEVVGLFDSEKQPEVVLWGSSNTVSKRSFAPFLQSFLSVEILNESISAGGIWSSMLKYFIYHEGNNYPKLAIWAVPYRSMVKFNDTNIYRQVIPAIYGACSDGSVQQETTYLEENDKAKERTIIIVSDSQHSINSSNHYLHLNLSDLLIKNFDVIIKHENGVLDTFSIERSTRIENNGKFFLEFSQDIESSIEEVFISLPEGAQGTLEANICKVPN